MVLDHVALEDFMELLVTILIFSLLFEDYIWIIKCEIILVVIYFVQMFILNLRRKLQNLWILKMLSCMPMVFPLLLVQYLPIPSEEMSYSGEYEMKTLYISENF